MDPAIFSWQIAGTGLVLMFGATVQATVGFGTGVFSIPMLLWLDWRLTQAISLMLPIIALQTGYSCWCHRQEIPWRSVGQFTLFRHLGLPLGLVALRWLDASGQQTVKVAVGVVVLLALAVGTVRRPVQHDLGWRTTGVAGVLSGSLAGMVGMGAPPLVLWLLAHDWSRLKSQTFLWMTILSMVPAQMVSMIYEWGPLATHSLLLGVALVPLGLIGSAIGLRLGKSLSKQRAHQAMTGLLAGVALYSILEPLIR